MNYYEILGVSIDATSKEIREAYLKLVKRYHPDVYTGEDSEEKMKAINLAYDTLIDSKKRQNYDRTIHTTQTRQADVNNSENLDEIISELKHKMFELNYEFECMSLRLKDGDIKSLKDLDVWLEKAVPLYNKISELNNISSEYNNIIQDFQKKLYNMLKEALYYKSNESKIYQKAIRNIKAEIFALEYELEIFCKRASTNDINVFEKLDIMTKQILDLYDTLELLLSKYPGKDYSAITMQLNTLRKQKERKIMQMSQIVEAFKQKYMWTSIKK